MAFRDVGLHRRGKGLWPDQLVAVTAANENDLMLAADLSHGEEDVFPWQFLLHGYRQKC